MLINTVILWLRDLLPVFIAGVLLFSMHKEKALLKSIALFTCTGLFLASVLIVASEFVNDLFAGAGLEIISTAFYLLSYGCFLWFLFKESSIARICTLTFLLTIKLMSFLIFISAYGEQTLLLNAVVLGLLIGAGISTSFAILMYFTLGHFYQKYGAVTIACFAMVFFAGQLSHIQPLLVQVDLMDEAAILWNTSWLIEDDSEYGHLFNSLFGYEATPSTTHIVIFMLALLPPIFTLFCKKIKQSNNVTEVFTGVHNHE